MSQTSKDRAPGSPADGVSLRKHGTGSHGSSGTSSGPSKNSSSKSQVAIPWTVNVACIAIGALILFTVIHLLLARGFTDQLLHLEKHANAVSKKPDKHFDAHHALAAFRKGALVQGLVFSVAVGFLGAAIRRTRTASGARWALLIIIVLLAGSQGPLTVVPISGYPGPMQVARVLGGVSSIAVIVFLIVPMSMHYFRDCKAASRPAGAPVRPGLSGLFAPRGAMTQRGAASGNGAAGRARRGAGGSRTEEPFTAESPRTAEEANPARAKAKAKVRTDADAVAKGADLARSRAKASKSRRSEST